MSTNPLENQVVDFQYMLIHVQPNILNLRFKTGHCWRGFPLILAVHSVTVFIHSLVNKTYKDV